MSTSFTTTPQFLPTILTITSFTNVTGSQVVEAVLSEINIFSALKLRSTVTKADITFTGGVIHIIDTVLTIQAISPAVPSLSLAQFASILEYHIINGTVAYSGLLSNTTIKTLNGGSVKITLENGNVFVNAARVTIPDVLVSNGVVHIIDNVLNPNNTNQALPSGTAAASPAYSGATNGTTSSSTSTGASTNASTSASASQSSASAMATGGTAKTEVMGAAAFVGVGALLLNM